MNRSPEPALPSGSRWDGRRWDGRRWDGRRWDAVALRAGAGVALVFAVPFSIAARWASDRSDDSTLGLWLSLGALAGFVIGAGCAAWVQRVGLPLQHALVTALATYTAAQAVFIAVKLARGGDVNWFAALFNLSAVSGAGLLGGLLGKRLRAKGIEPSINQRSINRRSIDQHSIDRGSIEKDRGRR